MTDLRIGDDVFNVMVEGDVTKPPLMLSHSLGADLTMWDAQVPALLEHFRVVRYDTRGHGGSAPTGHAVSIEQLGRDALAILDALEIDRVSWIGLSMGGVIGQWLLLNAPDRIERAVLANTAAKFGSPDIWNQRILTTIAGDRHAAVDATLERWFSAAFRDAAPEQVAAVDRVLRNTDPRGYAACCAAIRDMDLRQSLLGHPTIADANVLLITGKDDPTVSDADTAFLTSVFASAKHVALDARHISNVETAASFTTAVVDFLTSKPARRKTPAPARVSKPTPTVRRPPKTRSAARVPLRSAGKALVPAATTTTTAKPAARVAPAKPAAKTKTATKAPVKKPAVAKSKVTKAAPVAPKAARKTPTKTAATASRAGAAKASRTTARTAVGKAAATKSATAKKAAPKPTASKAKAASPAKAAPARRKPATVAARGAVKKPAAKAPVKRTAPAKTTRAAAPKAKPATTRTAAGKTAAKKTTASKAPAKATATKRTSAKPAATPKPVAKSKTVAKAKTVAKPKTVAKTKPAAKAPAARRKPAVAKAGRPVGRRKP